MVTPDLDYIANFLKVFIDSKKAHINIHDIKDAAIVVVRDDDSRRLDEVFLFHVQLMLENNLISNQDLQSYDLSSIGIRIGVDGCHSISLLPIRLTQTGHDFAVALNRNDVFEKLKTEFKDAPFRTLFDSSQKLLQHYFTKKLDKIMGDGS